MSETLTMSASEFKAKCLDVFGRLGDRSLDRVVVTKRGRVVAIVTPPDSEIVTAENLFGFMRELTVIPPDFDLTEPVIDPDDIAANHGILHY